MELTILLLTITVILLLVILVVVVGIARSLVKLFDWLSGGEKEEEEEQETEKMRAFRLWARQMGYDDASLRAMQGMMNMRPIQPNWDGVSKRQQKPSNLSDWIKDS